MRLQISHHGPTSVVRPCFLAKFPNVNHQLPIDIPCEDLKVYIYIYISTNEAQIIIF